MHANLILAIRRFIQLDEAEEAFISTLFTRRQYSKGDHFLREGQVCREAGFIEQGLVRYYNVNENGEEITHDFGKEYEFTSNYESFLDHSVSRRNIQCIEPSVIFCVSYEKLQLLYDTLREGQKFGRLLCEHLYLHALKKINSLYVDDPQERYLHFIRNYPDLQQRIPQYYVSSFVGVKPPSLSRIRKRMSN
jgi:CRP-like cAMP-binding protein